MQNRFLVTDVRENSERITEVEFLYGFGGGRDIYCRTVLGPLIFKCKYYI